MYASILQLHQIDHGYIDVASMSDGQRSTKSKKEVSEPHRRSQVPRRVWYDDSMSVAAFDHRDSTELLKSVLLLKSATDPSE